MLSRVMNKNFTKCMEQNEDLEMELFRHYLQLKLIRIAMLTTFCQENTSQ